jgi:hypothetical protein
MSLGNPTICIPHGLFLGLALLVAFSSPQQAFHIPTISNILESLLKFSLHPHSFMHCSLRTDFRDSDLSHITYPLRDSFEIWIEDYMTM